MKLEQRPDRYEREPTMEKSTHMSRNIGGGGMLDAAPNTAIGATPNTTISSSSPNTQKRHASTTTYDGAQPQQKKPKKGGIPKGGKYSNHPQVARPKRPRSAYNLFFKDQRNQMLREAGEELSDDDEEETNRFKVAIKDPSEDAATEKVATETTKRKRGRPRGPNYKPRKVCKRHGAFSFSQLAKLIGPKWKNLDEASKRFYKEQAAVDLIKYKEAMKIYSDIIERIDREAEQEAQRPPVTCSEQSLSQPTSSMASDSSEYCRLEASPVVISNESSSAGGRESGSDRATPTPSNSSKDDLGKKPTANTKEATLLGTTVQNSKTVTPRTESFNSSSGSSDGINGQQTMEDGRIVRAVGPTNCNTGGVQPSSIRNPGSRSSSPSSLTSSNDDTTTQAPRSYAHASAMVMAKTNAVHNGHRISSDQGVNGEHPSTNRTNGQKGDHKHGGLGPSRLCNGATFEVSNERSGRSSPTSSTSSKISNPSREALDDPRATSPNGGTSNLFGSASDGSDSKNDANASGVSSSKRMNSDGIVRTAITKAINKGRRNNESSQFNRKNSGSSSPGSSTSSSQTGTAQLRSSAQASALVMANTNAVHKGQGGPHNGHEFSSASSSSTLSGSSRTRSDSISIPKHITSDNTSSSKGKIRIHHHKRHLRKISHLANGAIGVGAESQQVKKQSRTGCEDSQQSSKFGSEDTDSTGTHEVEKQQMYGVVPSARFLVKHNPFVSSSSNEASDDFSGSSNRDSSEKSNSDDDLKSRKSDSDTFENNGGSDKCSSEDGNIGSEDGKFGSEDGKFGSEDGKFGSEDGKFGSEDSKFGSEDGNTGSEDGNMGEYKDDDSPGQTHTTSLRLGLMGRGYNEEEDSAGGNDDRSKRRSRPPGSKCSLTDVICSMMNLTRTESGISGLVGADSEHSGIRSISDLHLNRRNNTSPLEGDNNETLVSDQRSENSDVSNSNTRCSNRNEVLQKKYKNSL